MTFQEQWDIEKSNLSANVLTCAKNNNLRQGYRHTTGCPSGGIRASAWQFPR